MTGKDLIRLLQQNGWVLDRVSSSHHVLKKGGVSVSVPVHAKRELPIGTLQAILKKAGLK